MYRKLYIMPNFEKLGKQRNLFNLEENLSFLRDLKYYINCFFDEFKVCKIYRFLCVYNGTNTNPNANKNIINIYYVVVDCRGT